MDSKLVPSDGATDDIDDRIDRSYLVEMDLVDRDAMDSSLGFGKALENTVGDSPCRGADSRPGDALEDLLQIAMRWILGSTDLKFLGSETLFSDRCDRKAGSQPHRVDRGLNFLEVRTAVDQCRQSHIATDTAGTIQISDPHVRISFLAGTQREGFGLLQLDKQMGQRSPFAPRF
jgi:hypothetical protein